MIHLTIKGNPEQARQACRDHGIEVGDRQGQKHFGRDETYITIHETSMDVIRAWFHEQGYEGPFPIGTILFFRDTYAGE